MTSDGKNGVADDVSRSTLGLAVHITAVYCLSEVPDGKKKQILRGAITKTAPEERPRKKQESERSIMTP